MSGFPKRMRLMSRSRSVTPGPESNEGVPSMGPPPASHIRRQLIMANAASNACREPEVEPEPRLWKPSLNNNTGFTVQRTPGGTMRVAEMIQLECTPRGSIKRKHELEECIHVTPLERAAACDMDVEDGTNIFADANKTDHVRKWISELPSAVSRRVPEALAQEDVKPSTSGSTLKRSAPGSVADGSEFDSDFDDEFDVEEIVATGAMPRDIPNDDELEEPVRQVVSTVERAMDDAFDRLIGTEISLFDWREDFESFQAVPEQFSGPTPGPVNDYNMPYDAFTDIWSEDIIRHIVTETNRYAQQTIESMVQSGTMPETSRLKRWKNTDVDEIYTLFAIYIFMGLDPRTSQHEYWKTTGYLEMPKFRLLMSYNRFLLLNKFLHFTDNSVQDGPRHNAKLQKIAPVLDHLNKKFGSLYHLNQDIAIDESLTLFKGRLSWIQAIRTKAARFGIKSYELCESRTGYLSQFDIYTGKNSDCNATVAPSADLAGKSAQVVLELLKGLHHRGHCVTMDNFYNSPALARHLKHQGFDCLGTLRSSRKNVPQDIAKAPKNVPKGTIISRHAGDVSCLAWKDTKLVTMISTYHSNDTVLGKKAGRPLIKPTVVKDYNNTMGGVDLKDQKLSMYLIERKRCLKWYMKIFKRLLNVSVHNSFVMLITSLKRRHMLEITHRDFREKLANSIVAIHRPDIERPLPSIIPITQIMRLRRDIIHVPTYLTRTTRLTCQVCARVGKKKQVYLKCITCDEGMCFENCWRDWHSLQNLPGRDIRIRKGRRRN